ncbi:MAG: electron transfer flavoprotein subunit alpha/FixB family protein [Gemmatimonadetes bacterium]|nr:electron transfer flavoprotein subunit alpha/FixB family protein [Gemmatimonadota bacterium]
MATVLAFAETRGGRLRTVALEAATAARGVADALGADVAACVFGPPGVEKEAEALRRHGADVVVCAAGESFARYSPEPFTHLLAEEMARRDPLVAVFPASALGKDLAPRVAARLRVGLASEVTELRVEGGALIAVRPVYAGKAFASVRFASRPALVSIRPNVFQPRENPRSGTPAEAAANPVTISARTRVVAFEEEQRGELDVAEAPIVVSGGRGMKGPEHWQLLEALVEALGPRASLGASRAVVDAGWRPHAEQVGQTGKVVSPEVYFAIGISGAIQHQAGMRTAKVIVAVNKDPEAPIFKLVDYGIVGDLFEVLPKLTEEIRKLRASAS